LHVLTGEHTMLQATALRVADSSLFAPPMLIANGRHADEIEAQLAAIGIAARPMVLEPAGRNTAPAVGLAVLAAAADDLLLILPSDHVIADVPAFRAAIARAVPLAAAGWLVTFGIRAERPETGYGYIRRGEALGDGAFAAAEFVEKPDRATAEAYVANGGYDWNGGIFLFRAGRLGEELEAHAPDIAHGLRAAMDGARERDGRLYPEAEAFAAIRAESIDYAVMERSDRVAVVPVAMGWSDLGSWDALYELAEKDEANTVATGAAIAIDSGNCLVRSDGPTVVTVGVDDLIVIATAESILVLPRGESQRARDAAGAATRRGSEK
ncbi:MAG: mannose-1-phosphate guanylyltransferase, partial [Sphingomonas sp.]